MNTPKIYMFSERRQINHFLPHKTIKYHSYIWVPLKQVFLIRVTPSKIGVGTQTDSAINVASEIAGKSCVLSLVQIIGSSPCSKGLPKGNQSNLS